MFEFLDRPLFRKPEFLKPEINTYRYYLHVGIIAVVVLYILQQWKGGEMLTLWNVLVGIILITFSDTIAHTLLQMD